MNEIGVSPASSKQSVPTKNSLLLTNANEIGVSPASSKQSVPTKNSLLLTNANEITKPVVVKVVAKLTTQKSSQKITYGSPKPWRRDTTPVNGDAVGRKITNKSSGSLKINGSPKPWRDTTPVNGAAGAGKISRKSSENLKINGSPNPWRDKVSANGAAVAGKTWMLPSVRSATDLHTPEKQSLHRTVLLLNSQSVTSLPGQDVIDAKVTSRDTTCSCCGGDLEYAEGTEDESPGMALSWRRLYISRAKLQAAGTASELLFGFAMIGLVELQINRPTHLPEGMFVLFSVNTAFLVIVHIFALMISTFILPSIDTVKSLHPRALVAESPHYRMRWSIEIAWLFSTLLGSFLFLFEVVLFAWFKFWDYSISASIASSAFLAIAISIFIVFALYFYHTIHVHVYDFNEVLIKDLELGNRRFSKK